MKRLLVTFVFSLFFIPIQYAEASGFPDVQLYQDEIEYLVDQEVIRGYPDGTFQPERNLSRLQAVQMLLKAKGITDFTAPNPNFTDMPQGNYGYAEVAKAVELGIISGKTNKDGSKYFDLNGVLTRGQMAKIIVEAEGFPLNKQYTFSDVPDFNNFRDYISTLAAERITGGYSDGTYRPSLAVSRQHFAVFVARMLSDEFKPSTTNLPTSYFPDKSKKYTWVYQEGNEQVQAVMHYSNKSYVGEAGWDLWEETSAEGTGYFITKETALGLNEVTCIEFDGIYCEPLDEGSYIALVYPLFQGKKWKSFNRLATQNTVVSMNRTITTKAGIFKKVVEVIDSDGWTYYYAPGVGIIQTMVDGQKFAELIKIE